MTKKQKEIFFLRFEKELTLQEIGNKYNISRERVRQIINTVKDGRNYNKDHSGRKYRKEYCEFCFIKKEELKTSLNIHHLNGNHKDNNPHNLMTLCFNCHHNLHEHFKRLRA